MITDGPKFTPETCGGAAGCVCPAAMNTVAGLTVTLAVSPLESATVTPPWGAGEARATASGAVWPGASVRLEGSVIVPAACTVTVALASDIPEIAATPLTTAVPGATPVMVTVAVVALCGITTDDGAVTTPAGAAVMFTVRPPVGAGADSRKVRFFDSVPASVIADGSNPSEAMVRADWLDEP